MPTASLFLSILYLEFTQLFLLFHHCVHISRNTAVSTMDSNTCIRDGGGGEGDPGFMFGFSI